MALPHVGFLPPQAPQIFMIDEEYIVSASVDGSLGTWCIQDNDIPTLSVGKLPSSKLAVDVVKCSSDMSVLAIAVDRNKQEIATLCFTDPPLNDYVSIWDTRSMQQKNKYDVEDLSICMGILPGHNSYAIGSMSCVTLLDPRSREPISQIASMHQGDIIYPRQEGIQWWDYSQSGDLNTRREAL